MWKQFKPLINTQPMNFWGHGGVHYAQPSPAQSFAFYDALLTWGQSVGEAAVFSDFLGDQTSIQQMNMDLVDGDAVRQWLLGFDAATLKHNMTMQMCMELPSNLLQSLEMNSVTNARSSGDGGRTLQQSMGVAFMLQSSLGLGPSKDNVVTASTPVSQAIVACLSRGPFGLGDGVNLTNATIVMAAARADGWILQPTRTVAPIDRTYSNPGALKGQQVWIADSHLKGFNRPWFQVLGIADARVNSTWSLPLLPEDFYSAALWEEQEAERWDGSLARHFAYPWNHGCLRNLSTGTSCPLDIFQRGDRVTLRHAGGAGGTPAKDLLDYLQVAPALGDSQTILLGEVDKFVPASPVRFGSLTAVTTTKITTPAGQPHAPPPRYSLLVRGAAGEQVTVTCAHAQTGRLHRTTVEIGHGGEATVTIDTETMWRSEM
jgi:hypothetical protein